MIVDNGSIDHLNQIISQVVGPSFLLGAVASYISLLFSRNNGVLDRIRSINALSGDDPYRGPLKEDLPRLKRRAVLLQRAILLSICAGLLTALLLIVAFASAFLGFHHALGSALMFMLALLFFAGALVVLVQEVMISHSEYDHF